MVMADRGFTVEEELATRGVTLVNLNNSVVS